MADQPKIDWADDESDGGSVANWADDVSEDENEAQSTPARPAWSKPMTQAPPAIQPDDEEFPALGAQPGPSARKPRKPAAPPSAPSGLPTGPASSRGDYGAPRGGYDCRDSGDRGYNRGDRGGFSRYSDSPPRGGDYERAPRQARPPPVVPEQGPWTAFLGNLDFRVSPEEIENFFAQAGCKLPRDAVRMSKDRDDRPRGIAHVDFEDAKSLRIALNLDGNDFVGRSLRVDVAENKRRDDRRGGGFSHREGDGYGRPERSSDDTNWRELAKKAQEERAAEAPEKNYERDQERKDDREHHGRPAKRPAAREPATLGLTEEEERAREEKKKALEEKRNKGASPFGEAKPRDELSAQKKLQEIEERRKQAEEEKKKKQLEEDEKRKKRKEEEEEERQKAAKSRSPESGETKNTNWRDAPASKGGKPATGRGAWNSPVEKRGKPERKEGGRGRTDSPPTRQEPEAKPSNKPARKDSPAAAAPTPTKAAKAKPAAPAAKARLAKEGTPANAFDLLGEAEA